MAWYAISFLRDAASMPPRGLLSGSSARSQRKEKLSASRALPPHRLQNSIARPPPLRNVLSSRCRRRNYAAKSIFSANYSRGPRLCKACADLLKTQGRIRICRDVGQPLLTVRISPAEAAGEGQEWLSYKNPFL